MMGNIKAIEEIKKHLENKTALELCRAKAGSIRSVKVLVIMITVNLPFYDFLISTFQV